MLHTPEILDSTAPYDLVRRMRASVLVLGPLLARCGEARVSLPGGCAIGTRPIDLHLAGLERMGVVIELEDGYVHARAHDGLQGRRDQPAATLGGATENLLMAAATAKGETTIVGAAREPEIVDLAGLLVSMGQIEGAGSSSIRIAGIPKLQATRYPIIGDRVEAATYAMAAAITGGRVELRGARIEHFGAAAKLQECGMRLETVGDGLVVSVTDGGLKGGDVMTQPFPGFATDLQAQFMALMCRAEALR